MTSEPGEPLPVRGAVSSGRALTVFGAVAGSGLALDAATKAWAVAALQPEIPVPVVGNLLTLYLIRNPGAAFSLGTGHTWIFTILATVVLAGLLIKVVPRLRHVGWAVGLGLVTAGIAGNLVDRLVRPPGFAVGHVVDFLQLPHWPIFNVADICVTGGAAWVLWVVFRLRVRLDGTPEAADQR